MKKEDKATIRGILIGDSHVRIMNSSAELSIQHSTKQKEYFLYKKDFLQNVFEREIKHSEYTYNGYDLIRLAFCHPYLKYCYSWLYKPKKLITLKYLRKVNNHGIAFWYMDDGSLYAKRRNSKIHAYELVFSIYGELSEAEDTIYFMKERFDCVFTLKRNKGKYSVRCGTKQARKFLSQISKYIPDCMLYKTFRNKEKPIFDAGSI